MASLLALVLVGCANQAPSSGSSSGAPATTPAAAETPAAAGAGGWMDGIPASVPKFEYGTFDAAQSSQIQAGDQTIYSLYYEGVDKTSVEAYIEKLKTAGFEITPGNAGDGVSAAGELKNASGEILIGFSISQQSNGHVDYTINAVKPAN
jgi:carotenoid cleavage dioxygenase-like enzyme